MSLFEQKSLLAKLMATENMMIRQGNVPTASFDVLNRVLTVPVLDKNLSKELYDLFMGHECGHALWTPLEGMKKAKEEKVNMSVLNVVEDSRIERKIKNKYPGIKTPFVKAYSELFEKNFFETEGKDLSKFNFIDRVNLHCKIGASLTLPFTEEERQLLNEVESTETYDDVVKVTKKICEFMKDQLQEEQEKQLIKVKILVPADNDSQDDNSEGEGQGEGEGNDDADVEILVQSQNSEEKSSDKEGEEQKSSEKSQTGSGAGGQNLEESIRSFTDDALKRNEKNLFSKETSPFFQPNGPEVPSSSCSTSVKDIV